MIKNTQLKVSYEGFSVDGAWYSNERLDIQNWLAGKDDEWLELEEQFNNGEIDTLPDLIPNVPEPEFTQAELDDQVEAKRKSDIKAAGLALMNEVFPALKDLNEIKFQAEFWLSIKPTAKQATDDFQYVIDVYTTAKQAISSGALIDDVAWP